MGRGGRLRLRPVQAAEAANPAGAAKAIKAIKAIQAAEPAEAASAVPGDRALRLLQQENRAGAPGLQPAVRTMRPLSGCTGRAFIG